MAYPGVEVNQSEGGNESTATGKNVQKEYPERMAERNGGKEMVQRKSNRRSVSHMPSFVAVMLPMLTPFPAPGDLSVTAVITLPVPVLVLVLVTRAAMNGLLGSTPKLLILL